MSWREMRDGLDEGEIKLCLGKGGRERATLLAIRQMAVSILFLRTLFSKSGKIDLLGARSAMYDKNGRVR
eukprot:1356642-Amorphochlora_amoeboformis.AAC.1